MSVFGKAELGGKTILKWVTGGIMVSMWLFYIIMSSLQVYGKLGDI